MSIYDRVNSAINRLEYLRGELRSERILQDELLELQGLVKHIAPGDVELLEAAGVPEHPATEDAPASATPAASLPPEAVNPPPTPEVAPIAPETQGNGVPKNTPLAHPDNVGHEWEAPGGRRRIIGMTMIDGIDRYVVQTGAKGTFNQIIKPSELEAEIKRDTANLEHRKKQDAQEAVRKQAEADTLAKRNDTDGFADGLAPMQREKVVGVLTKDVHINGKMTTRKEYVRERINNGYRVVNDPDHGRLLRRDLGRAGGPDQFDAHVMREATLTKTGMDYADYLGKKKDAAPRSSPATEDAYTTEEQAVIDGLRSKGYCVIIWTPEEMERCTASCRHLEDAVISHAHEHYFECSGDPETDSVFGEAARNGESGFDVDIDLTPAQNLDMYRSGLFMSEYGSARYWVWSGTDTPATEPAPKTKEESAGDDVCDVCGRSGVTCSRVTQDGRTMGNECGCADREGDDN